MFIYALRKLRGFPGTMRPRALLLRMASGRYCGTVRSLLRWKSVCRLSLVRDGVSLACWKECYSRGPQISPWVFPSCRSYRISSAHFGVHRNPQLATVEGAREFLSSLPPSHRSNLNAALQKISVSEEERGKWFWLVLFVLLLLGLFVYTFRNRQAVMETAEVV